jgi:hypothetical protein
MTTVLRTLLFVCLMLLMFSIDVLNEFPSELNSVNEAQAWVRGPVGVGGVGVAGVARRTTRRVVVGTAIVVK